MSYCDLSIKIMRTTRIARFFFIVIAIGSRNRYRVSRFFYLTRLLRILASEDLREPLLLFFVSLRLSATFLLR